MTQLVNKLIKGLRVSRQRSYRRALRRGVAASIEHDAVPLPTEIATVLDIGANRGQFAIYACGRFPIATVHSFEPIPAARAKLESVIPPDRAVKTYDVALASEPGKAEFNVSADDDSSSLLKPSGDQVASFPGARTTGRIMVQRARLDDLLDASELTAPVLMKLDVQGSELDVLKGAPQTLEKTDFVLVECSFVTLYEGQALAGEVIGFLADHGFDLAGFYSPTVENGRLLQADALLIHRGVEAPQPVA